MGQHGKHRPLVILRVAALALLAAWPGGGEACRLALALALDVSSSVDAAEDRLQRKGLAAALLAPEVQRAFFASDDPVALAIYEWSGRYKQHLLLDWRLIVDRAALAGAARTIALSQRSESAFPTAMGYALGYGAGLLARAPACLFKTLDIAGDGLNNEGFPPASAYAEFPFAEVIVNGLVVRAGEAAEDEALIDFYQTEVLHGPGAFLELADGFKDYERAMRRKLERELDVPSLGAMQTGQGKNG